MRRFSTALALFAFTCSIALPALADEPAQVPVKAARSPDALDSVVLLDGEVLRGVVLSSDEGGVTIRLRSGEERRIAASEVTTVNHWAPTPIAAAPKGDAGGKPDEIPGGHFYLGLGLSSVTLPRGSKWNNDESVSPSGDIDAGFTLGLNASIELERFLFTMTAELGAGGSGVLSRAGVLVGYTLTEQSSPPYVALGFSSFGKTFGFGDDPVSGTSASGLTAEAGWLIGRSHRFGRITIAVTAVVPVAASAGVWTPWLGLGLRFQL